MTYYKNDNSDNTIRVLAPLIAVLIIGLWSFSIYHFLFISDEPNIYSVYGIICIFIKTVWMTLLYTGLFITAHDSMHGLTVIGNVKMNNLIGKISLLLYALFSYKNLLVEHIRHHKSPGSHEDPDFYHHSLNDRTFVSFLKWYLHFILHYVTWLQLFFMAIVANVLLHILNVQPLNLVFFWILPSLLSTLQLFYFGTYLPHRKSINTQLPYHAQNISMSRVLALITCYNFGAYHLEHHKSPSTPWWRLS
jgi:beta-carotene/zeaxanthin 4-ketolase